MSARPGVFAAAASDSYVDRPQADSGTPTYLPLDGERYKVFAYVSDARTGFHGTAYQSVATGDIIVSCRGTDPDFRHHPLTTVQDVVVDFQMVRDQVNNQEAAASDFVRQ